MVALEDHRRHDAAVRSGYQCSVPHLEVQREAPREGQAAAQGSIGQAPRRSQVSESDAMGETPGVEVEPSHMRSRHVLAVIHGKTQATVCHERVLEVVKAIECVHRMRELIIRLGQEVILVVWRAEVSGELLKRGGHQDRCLQML